MNDPRPYHGLPEEPPEPTNGWLLFAIGLGIFIVGMALGLSLAETL